MACVKDQQRPLTAQSVRDAVTRLKSHVVAAFIPGARPFALLLALLGYAALRPIVAVGHEWSVAAIAWLLHAAVGTGAWEPIIPLLGLDPIYVGAAIRAAGSVVVKGFAVGGWLGATLHSLLPGVFLAPAQLAKGAGVSMVAAPGAAALGRGLASFGADVVWLTLGLWLFWRWRRRSWLIATLGLLLQAQVAINQLFNAHVSLADVDASGLPFALELAVPSGGWFTGGLGALPAQTRDLLTGGSLVLLGYACALFLLGLGRAVLGLCRLFRRTGTTPRVTLLERWGWLTALASVGLALATACSPLGGLALGSSNWQAATVGPDLTALGSSGVDSSAGDYTPRLSGPTQVSMLQQPDGTWQYLVDGAPETIRGVGYNPWYAGQSPVVRASLYDRDFAEMHRLGFNTIEGWFENQFDSVTLDAAARNGIGVLMPFELNQDWDYTDPNVQATILSRVSDYVELYKDNPAVRMWAPGNENLHRILFAHWISQQNDPTARARAAAFAAFLPVLVDRIHQLDPDHPVLYRDAADLYLNWITQGFGSSSADRPWLVYGANVYSAARMQGVIANWPNQWPGRPLLISEFAPGGMGPSDRPLGFQQLWSLVRSRPGVVLGGMAYVWATNGPEDLDRVFGLVDPSGNPTDGALAALSAEYLADARIRTITFM
jgi:hypothetical protein